MAVYLSSFTRVNPERGFSNMGPVWLSPRQIVAVGPYEAHKVSSDDAEAQDAQGNLVTEILLATGHTVFVSETASDVVRKLGAY